MVDANRGNVPSVQETFMQMAKAAGLRGRILLTIGILLLVRFGIHIPIPNINRAAFAASLQGSPLFGLVDIFSGGGIAALGVLALGILPYINASIIMQLLTGALPSLEKLQKEEGEAGRRKISAYTRYLTLFWAVIQSVGVSVWVLGYRTVPSEASFIISTTLALTAGAMFVTWLGELITERGIGNGASLLIFINIVATLPRSFAQTISLIQADSSKVGGLLVLLLVLLVMIVGIVFVQEGTRRIPIVSAKRQVGRLVAMEQRNYLPLRLNQSGVMPIIFASSVLFLPATIAQSIGNEQLLRIANALSPSSPQPWIYLIAYLSLILFFSYFYTSVLLNPVDMAQNLKKAGTSIPGIRPGKATAEYLEGVINRLTFLGAIFLGAVAILPTAVERATGVTTFQGLGATSLLILVGVAIDTARQIQTYVISQRYEGMVKA
ncbi:MAG: preprotein translocase subunit SecY [Thermostichales cyanobacterium SZTDM-1c_bins_54]